MRVVRCWLLLPGVCALISARSNAFRCSQSKIEISVLGNCSVVQSMSARMLYVIREKSGAAAAFGSYERFAYGFGLGLLGLRFNIRAGDDGGAVPGRTKAMSGETSRCLEVDKTCATAPTCGWHNLRIRGKDNSVCTGIHPS